MQGLNVGDATILAIIIMKMRNVSDKKLPTILTTMLTTILTITRPNLEQQILELAAKQAN